MARAVDAALRVSLLGGFRVVVDGADVEGPWRLRKARTLVKILALAPGHRAHREVLQDELWPDLAPAAASNNFHQAMHAARRLVGPARLVLNDDVAVLGPDGDLVVDVEEFAQAATSARASGTVADLAAGLALWRGELLPEDLYEDWAAAPRESLARLRTAVTLQLADAQVADDRPDEAVGLLEPLAHDHPLDEAVHRSLITALAAAGRRWDAAAVYERLRERLDASLGARPEPTTTDVYRRLFVGGSPAGGPVAHNLPAFATSFVGRHRELSELDAALDRTRLLTLTGPGGCGKTRLAVELAHRRLSRGGHADGVWLVELAGTSRSDLVPVAVATALRLTLHGDRPWADALGDQLRDRHLLLVLDNCEHVVAVAAVLADELLARCPGLSLVTTSREPLGLAGEQTYRVPSLELPGAEPPEQPAALARRESVQLFVERAGNAAPGFRLDEVTAPAVAEICRRLDGIPFALELAAARTAHLSVAQLAERLGDALTLFGRTTAGRLDRSQTLESTLRWSHDLLLDDERVVFRRLSVFAGGFDLDAAAEVCAVPDVLAVLSRLVDKSLVVAVTGAQTARYRLLEVVRQYAAARLAEAREVATCRRRHRRWYGRHAAAADPDGGQPVVREPPPWFDTEQDNLRAALSSAIGSEPALGLRLAASTWRFFLSRGQIAEGLGWLTGALDRYPDLDRPRARALFGLAVLHVRRAEIARLPEIGRSIVEASASTGDDRDVALALDQHAILVLGAMDWRKASRISAASLDRGGGDPQVVAAACHLEGVIALARGDSAAASGALAAASDALGQVPDDAAPFFTALSVSWVVDSSRTPPLPLGEETMVHGLRVGAEQARGYVEVAAANADRAAGRGEDAVLRLDHAVTRFERLEDVYGLAYAISQRAHTSRSLGRLDVAAEDFQQAETWRRSLRDVRATALAIMGRSLVEALAGRGSAARGLAEHALGMMRRSGDTPGHALAANNAAVVELVLGDPAAAAVDLEASLALGERFGPVHVLGWQYLLLAHVRHLLGDGAGSTAALATAVRRFDAFADERGAAAVLSARKAGLVTIDS